MDKKGQKGMGQNTQFWIFLAVILIVAAGLGANIPVISQFLGATGVNGANGGVQPIEVSVKQPERACGSTTMTVDFVEKYNEGTDVTAQNATVYINGGKKGIFSEGGTFTAQGGDSLRIYYALDPAGTTYYASHAAGTIPCTGQTSAFLTSSSFMGAGDLTGKTVPANKVYKASTAPSFSVVNLEDYSSNPSSALSVGAGGSKVARVTITWPFEQGYGVADGSTLACRFTDSQIDQSAVVAQYDGSTLGAASHIPTSTIFAVSATNQSIKYWSLPAIDGAEGTTKILDLTIKGDSNNQPTAATNFSCGLLDTDLYELDAGGVTVGVEDVDDNSNIGRASNDVFNILLS